MTFVRSEGDSSPPPRGAAPGYRLDIIATGKLIIYNNTGP